MDSASIETARLREIVDRLLASPLVEEDDRAFLANARNILDARPTTAPAVVMRHDPRTVPEPSIASLTMPGGDR
jgi:hypothetical protein